MKGRRPPKPNTYMRIQRMFSPLPETLSYNWLRHELTIPELKWFRSVIWQLFGTDMTFEDEVALHDMIAAYGKMRTVRYLLWERDQFGEKSTISKMALTGHIEFFEASSDPYLDAILRRSEEETADLLAQLGM